MKLHREWEKAIREEGASEQGMGGYQNYNGESSYKLTLWIAHTNCFRARKECDSEFGLNTTTLVGLKTRFDPEIVLRRTSTFCLLEVMV